jgi:hypothetical protein
MNRTKLLNMMKDMDEQRTIQDLDDVRRVLYSLLTPVISEIIDYDNSDEVNEEKIEGLFHKKDMIEKSIGTLNVIIMDIKNSEVKS